MKIILLCQRNEGESSFHIVGLGFRITKISRGCFCALHHLLSLTYIRWRKTAIETGFNWT